MFAILKVMTLAILVIIGSIYLAPLFTQSAQDTDAIGITEFRMNPPVKAPGSGRYELTIDHVKAMASMDKQDFAEIDYEMLQQVAEYDPQRLAELFKAGLEGDAEEQVNEIVTLAVSKTKAVIEGEGFFLQPGQTR